MLAASSVLTAVLAGGAGQPAASPSARALVERGLAAGARFPGLADVCRLPSDGPASPPRLPVRTASAEAVRATRVFDNLVFVGTANVSSWVLETSAGLILIDTLDDEPTARTFIEGGLRRLGLDPARLAYVIVTHAHPDHHGGLPYLARTYRPRVVMGEADWKAAELLGVITPRPGDLSVRTRTTVTLGDTTVHVDATPGHTLGTVSLTFEVRDGRRRHTAALWGGTGLNFGPDVTRLRTYAASAEAFGEVARRAGVDVFLSNHPFLDGSLTALPSVRARRPGEPHPLVAGPSALGAFELLRFCAAAQALALEGERAK